MVCAVGSPASELFVYVPSSVAPKVLDLLVMTERGIDVLTSCRVNNWLWCLACKSFGLRPLVRW